MRPVFAFVVFFGAIATAIVSSAAVAQTPTGTATSTPTPGPSPTPVTLVTVGVRFVKDGQPVSVFLWQPISGISADGKACNFPVSPTASFYPGYETNWPLASLAGQAYECTKGPPTNLYFEFQAPTTILSTEFVWSGGDTIVDLDITPFIGETPSPKRSQAPASPIFPDAVTSPPASPRSGSPEKLPATGGDASPSNFGALAAAGGLTAGLGLTCAGAALIRRKR